MNFGNWFVLRIRGVEMWIGLFGFVVGVCNCCDKFFCDIIFSLWWSGEFFMFWDFFVKVVVFCFFKLSLLFIWGCLLFLENFFCVVFVLIVDFFCIFRLSFVCDWRYFLVLENIFWGVLLVEYGFFLIDFMCFFWWLLLLIELDGFGVDNFNGNGVSL